MALAFLAMVALPATFLGDLYAHMHVLNAGIRSGEARVAATELDEVTSFYGTGRRWGVSWVADRLFADVFLQRAAAEYLAGNYEQVVMSLENRVDDPRASHLLGCAKFRLAQRRYREVTGRDARAIALRSAIVQEVIDTINPVFERAVRADGDTFANKWNYDLTSSPDPVRRALEAPPIDDPPEIDRRSGAKSPVRLRRG